MTYSPLGIMNKNMDKNMNKNMDRNMNRNMNSNPIFPFAVFR